MGHALERIRGIKYTEVLQMIIQHNMTAANAKRQLGSVVKQQAKSTEKLSSGYRINRAADDAAGLSISEKMRGQIRGLEKASTNAQDGISLIQTAEGALSETHSILQRMRELTVQASNDTNSAEDRGNIQDEIDQLKHEITRIGTDTQFNKMNVLNGGKDASAVPTAASATFDCTLQVGANDKQKITFKIAASNATSLGVNAIKVNDGNTTSDAISAHVTTIDNAIQSVSKTRSALGAYQNRLEHTISNLDNTAENLQSAESNIRDVDMAKEMVNYSKNSIIQQAAQSMLSQANQSNQGVLSLLQ